MSIQKLSQDQITAGLAKLDDWQYRDGGLCKQFRFRDFISAFGFVSQVALLSECANHHPQLTHVYNRVDISLWTHEIDGISSRDFSLAEQIDGITPRSDRLD